jgi:hypothetical protein
VTVLILGSQSSFGGGTGANGVSACSTGTDGVQHRGCNRIGSREWGMFSTDIVSEEVGMELGDEGIDKGGIGEWRGRAEFMFRFWD